MPSIELGMKLDPGDLGLSTVRDLASYDLRSNFFRFFSSAMSGAPPLELHPSTSMRLRTVGPCLCCSPPHILYLYRFDAPRIAAHSSRTARLRGLQILNASRIAVLLGEYIKILWNDWSVHAEPSIELLG